MATVLTCESRSTGKERDSETGLDYFGARYYGSSMARFVTPDSTAYSGLTNPQSWNLYAYTLNNPVRFTDLNGHSVQCHTAKDACLAGAQASVANKEAASRLKIKTTIEKASFLRRLFTGDSVVIKNTVEIEGDSKSFAALGGNASKLADLINSKYTFGLSLSSSYSMTYTSALKNISSALIGGETPLRGGSTSSTSYRGEEPEAWVDPSEPSRDPDAVGDNIPPANVGEKIAHELLGHVWAAEIARLAPGTAEHKKAVLESENEVRRTDPSRGQKQNHHD